MEVITRGVFELQAAFRDLDVKVDPILGSALRAAAVPVQQDAQRRAGGYGAKTISGIHIRRRGTFVRVQQDARKTTRLHPEFGAFQQRSFFDPALADNQEQVIGTARVAIDAMAERVNRLP